MRVCIFDVASCCSFAERLQEAKLHQRLQDAKLELDRPAQHSTPSISAKESTKQLDPTDAAARAARIMDANRKRVLEKHRQAATIREVLGRP